LGDREPRKEINLLLQNSLVDPSPERRRLKEIIGHVRAGYLDRWANALKVEEDKRVKPERFSRTVAAHRLDLGFSASHLKVWARRLDHDRATAVEIAESAAKLARTRARPHEVLVALEKVPGRRELAEPLDDWRSKGEVITWLKDNGHDPAGIRTGGGFVYRLDALDPYGAAEQARQLLDRMVARPTTCVLTARASSLFPASGSPVTPGRYHWILLPGAPMSCPSCTRDTCTRSTAGAAASMTLSSSPPRSTAEAPAVAGGWAAVESLLVHADDPKGTFLGLPAPSSGTSVKQPKGHSRRSSTTSHSSRQVTGLAGLFWDI